MKEQTPAGFLGLLRCTCNHPGISHDNQGLTFRFCRVADCTCQEYVQDKELGQIRLV